jgi:hypothetical protein
MYASHRGRGIARGVGQQVHLDGLEHEHRAAAETMNWHTKGRSREKKNTANLLVGVIASCSGYGRFRIRIVGG